MSSWLTKLTIAVLVLLVMDNLVAFNVAILVTLFASVLLHVSGAVVAWLRRLSTARVLVLWGGVAAVLWGVCSGGVTTMSELWYVPDSRSVWLAFYLIVGVLAIWGTIVVLYASWPTLSQERGVVGLATAALICGTFALQVVAAKSLTGEFARLDWSPISRRYWDGVPPLGVEPSHRDPTPVGWLDDEVGPNSQGGRLGRLYQQVADAVVFIGDEDGGFGSGFVIRSDGLALTAFHVVTSGGPFRVRFRDGSYRGARLLRWNEASDVALLQIECGEGCPWIPVETRGTAVGTEVIVVGHPIDEKLSHTVTQGIVSSIRELDGAKHVQTDAAINGGNSGGPIVDVQTGRAIGIVSWGIGWFDSGLNFGIATDHTLEVLGIKDLFWAQAR